MRRAFCVVALCAVLVLLIRASRLGMAGDYIDAISHIGAQDESLYAHSAIQMARHGNWLTPSFMGRYGLYKPPLLAETTGLSARIFGISRLALRLPIVLIAGLAVGLVFWWASEIGGLQAGICAALLLISNHLWHTIASMCLTDGLLAAFYVAALYSLFADPWLESRWASWGYSGAVAAGILTKSVAGLLPLAVLGLYWILAPPKYKPQFLRVVVVSALSILMASPWFLYQLSAHGRWFRVEHIGIELLGFGVGKPPQTSQENQVLFYLSRAALLDPVLLAIAAASIPLFLREIRQRSSSAVLLLIGLGIPLGAVMFWQYRNVTYLMPVVPMLAVLAAGYNPLCRGTAAKWMLAGLAIAFAVKASAPLATWGLPFTNGTRVALAPVLSNYCDQGRGNELIAVDTPDEMYGSLLPLPKLRYVLHGKPPAAGQYSLDFTSMGIILSEQQFDNLSPYLSGFRHQLSQWGLPTGDPIGTVIFIESPAELAKIVAAHPSSDFLLPVRYRSLIASDAHETVEVSPDYLLLLSRQALPPPSERWTCHL